MLDALSARFSEAGLAERLHLERFSASAPLPAAGSGLELEVPADRSILAALREAGHTVASSCEQGVCGMCETRVLEGIPEHHDQLLTESERARGDLMMICVSRACSPSLTLDL